MSMRLEQHTSERHDWQADSTTCQIRQSVQEAKDGRWSLEQLKSFWVVGAADDAILSGNGAGTSTHPATMSGNDHLVPSTSRDTPPSAPRSNVSGPQSVPRPLCPKGNARKMKASASAPSNSNSSTSTNTWPCRFVKDCNKVFTRRGLRDNHERSIHTGEKPFVCHCGQTFSRKDNWPQHRDVRHKGETAENLRTEAEMEKVYADLERESKEGKLPALLAAYSAPTGSATGQSSSGVVTTTASSVRIPAPIRLAPSVATNAPPIHHGDPYSVAQQVVPHTALGTSTLGPSSCQLEFPPWAQYGGNLEPLARAHSSHLSSASLQARAYDSAFEGYGRVGSSVSLVGGLSSSSGSASSWSSLAEGGLHSHTPSPKSSVPTCGTPLTSPYSSATTFAPQLQSGVSLPVLVPSRLSFQTPGMPLATPYSDGYCAQNLTQEPSRPHASGSGFPDMVGLPAVNRANSAMPSAAPLHHHYWNHQSSNSFGQLSSHNEGHVSCPDVMAGSSAQIEPPNLGSWNPSSSSRLGSFAGEHGAGLKRRAYDGEVGQEERQPKRMFLGS